MNITLYGIPRNEPSYRRIVVPSAEIVETRGVLLLACELVSFIDTVLIGVELLNNGTVFVC